MKDLIHCPKQEYKLLLESVHKKVGGNLDDIPVAPQVLSSPSDVNSDLQQPQQLLPPSLDTLGMNTVSTDNMKVDLKEYIRELALKTNQQMN